MPADKGFECPFILRTDEQFQELLSDKPSASCVRTNRRNCSIAMLNGFDDIRRSSALQLLEPGWRQIVSLYWTILFASSRSEILHAIASSTDRADARKVRPRRIGPTAVIEVGRILLKWRRLHATFETLFQHELDDREIDERPWQTDLTTAS
jgi:hypothetical protein